MGRNYVSFDPKAAEARVRAERKRRERDRLKTEEAAIWDHLVAEQREAARSRSARQEQPKTKQRKRLSRYQGFVLPPDANHPQLLASMNRAKRFLSEDAVDRHVRIIQARLRQTARTLLREGTPEIRKRTLEALRDVRVEMRMARQEDGYF